MENQFFNKVIELTVKGFINNGNFNITATKSLVNDLKQFVKLYENTTDENDEPVKVRKPRKKRTKPTEETEQQMN